MDIKDSRNFNRMYQKALRSGALSVFVLAMMLTSCVEVNGGVVTPITEEPAPVVEIIDPEVIEPTPEVEIIEPTATATPTLSEPRPKSEHSLPEKSLSEEELGLILSTETPIVWPTMKPTHTKAPVKEIPIEEFLETLLLEGRSLAPNYADDEKEFLIYGYLPIGMTFEMVSPNGNIEMVSAHTIVLPVFHFEGREMSNGKTIYLIGSMRDISKINKDRMFPIKVKVDERNTLYASDDLGIYLSPFTENVRLEGTYCIYVVLLDKNSGKLLFPTTEIYSYSEEDWKEERLLIDKILKDEETRANYELILMRIMPNDMVKKRLGIH